MVNLSPAWLAEMRGAAPASNPRNEVSNQPALTFDDSTRTVRSGRMSARLSPTQYSLLQYVYTHGKVGFVELQDAVWRDGGTSDNAIKLAVTKTNKLLCEYGFSVALAVIRGRVALETLA